jgi:hypothetical protein
LCGSVVTLRLFWPCFSRRRAVSYDLFVGSLGLKKDDFFAYWFDLGDDWWPQIQVMDVGKKTGRGKYPMVTLRVEDSSPQYLDWEKEDDE